MSRYYSGFDVDHLGRRLYRKHTHACGHDDRCVLESFAKSTDCFDCRNKRAAEQALRDREAAS